MNGIKERLDEDWVVVSTYLRKQAIEDGVLVDVTDTAKEAGFVYPVALTRAVWERYVKVPDAVSFSQDEAGRLWDILWMLRAQIARGNGGRELRFELVVQNEPGKAKPVTLKAVCGPGDNAAEPVITVMLPEED